MTILVGTSGWSYDDWVGRFYPIELAKKKGEWFSYYSEYFNTVEINSTFYRPPSDFQVQGWIKKARNLESFEYSVKMPELVTHKSMVQGDLKRAAFWATSFEKMCVKPLAEAGLLGCVLLQLSPYFKNEGPALDIMKGLLDAVSHKEYNYAVEFRHRSWLDESRKEVDSAALDAVSHKEYNYAVEFRHRSWLDESRKEVDSAALDALKERNVANVLLDGPGLPVTKVETADHAYVRFHGRNYDIWFKEGAEDDHRLNRYDYLYEKQHLLPWVSRIKEAEIKAAKVRIYFNNHARAKAVRNAFQLMDMLLIKHKPKEIRLQDQFTLGEF
jgi:uncharacterized protein YecE (DUF72 family)